MTEAISLVQVSELLATKPIGEGSSPESNIASGDAPRTGACEPRKAITELAPKFIGINTDTRELNPGEIFVALKGEKYDGHQFAEAAISKGAVALVVSRYLELAGADSVPQLLVPDTLAAYQTIANWWRDRYEIPVIGITGSVGKTTTKELIAAVLGTQGKVLKTQANYNNEIGVPKTLLGITPDTDYAAIEMAMRAAGEIALLTKIARPTIGVITNVGTAHIGRLGSTAAIAQAKCELLAQMPTSGVAVLNGDNQLLLDTAAKVWQGETVTYGLTKGDIKGELVAPNIIRVAGEDFPLPLPGSHNASNYLAAIAVAQVLGIDLTPLKAGLTVELPQGRSRRYDLAHDVVLLDETYNAGLESMIAALQILKATAGKRHIAVLGTMKELGSHSARLHRQVGETARKLDINHLFVLIDEPETAEIATGAAGIETECFSNHTALINRLQTVVQPGDRLLFKASNSVGLSQVVEQFRANWN